jgi:hypothetical protein
MQAAALGPVLVPLFGHGKQPRSVVLDGCAET